MSTDAPEIELDPIGCALIAAGYAANEYLLDNDRSIQVPHAFPLSGHWALPSRMFRFPIETHACGMNGTRSIGVVHPLLADHLLIGRAVFLQQGFARFDGIVGKHVQIRQGVAGEPVFQH
jgi:hypothetical protein